MRAVKLSINESANLVIRECVIFWEKARIPTKSSYNAVNKLVELYRFWRTLQKNANKTEDTFKLREENFKNNLDNLFDIAHADALKKMRKQEDKIFLQHQREPGRSGYIAGVDGTCAINEEQEIKCTVTESPLTASVSVLEEDNHKHDPTGHEEFRWNDNEQIGIVEKRGRKSLITPKLAAALDRCQLSIRDSVFILQAIIEALGLNINDYNVNKSSIQRIRTEKRKERAKVIQMNFKNEVPNVVTVHWDGKLLVFPFSYLRDNLINLFRMNSRQVTNTPINK
ncbi:hypothetical protein ABEB36_009225 [Hypothenemus hampei]|uniref:Uncharacterized protein n=1 Tax=Hypothenemus hampei TaxID=57062 RepID=A0ABD1EPK5_HYPHA